MKTLVTGGAGFIGSHTAEYFISKGAQVAIIDDISHGTIRNMPEKTTLYQIDIRNTNAVNEVFEKEQPDVLVHLAAQIKTTASVLDPVHDAEVNIIGTLNLLEAGRRNNLKKVVYACSAAAIGEPRYLPIDEEHPLNMITGYGITKHTVEHYLSVYKHLYGIDYCSLRYANVYGPRQDSTGEGGVVAIFSEIFANNGIPTIFGDGEASRDFVYVKDVARANYMAAESKESGIFNVCTNTEISINELVKEFNTIYGKNITANYAPPREGDILKSYMTFDKIKNSIGWEPEFSFTQGLAETAKYYAEK